MFLEESSLLHASSCPLKFCGRIDDKFCGRNYDK
jgi:hypothetical protein